MIVNLQVPRSKELYEIFQNSQPIFQRRAHLSRGTTYYEANDSSCVLLLSLGKYEENSEADLVKEADNIPGMAKIIGSLDLVKTSELRKDLLFAETVVKWTSPDKKAMTTPLEFSGQTRVIPRESLRN
ncbi:Bgt-50889 [Blumeria graminis f. sp. tritici]|uniref:Bgt-50889 n=1 Tax=Blumeria graminis f. sp. tritici TaxID=62690 RepID=A0A9X9QEP2_BLUGR|nr:Bgt-50889 [Blumeria graminis f. sp. tritici]